MHASSEKDMRTSGLKNRLDGARDATIVADRINAFLRRRHPYMTAKQVASDTGIAPATISKWLERNSAPSCMHMGRLYFAYGIDFFAAAFPCPSLERAALVEQQAKLEAEAERIRARIAECRP